MGRWYEESFGYEYLELYAHRDVAEARADIEAVVRLLDPPRDAPLLDLCCGACRHLMILSEMGFTQLVGLDLSSELLDVGRQQMDGRDGRECPVQLVRSDMRQIPYQDYFATVLSLFTSFGYFEQDGENQAVFHAVYRALRPGGQFLIDYMNRDYVISHLVPEDEKMLPDRHIRNLRCLTADCRRVEKRTIVTALENQAIAGGPRVREFRESVRLYSYDEMVEMLCTAGFVGVTAFGSLDGTPYCSDTADSRVSPGHTSARPGHTSVCPGHTSVCPGHTSVCPSRLILVARKAGAGGYPCLR